MASMQRSCWRQLARAHIAALSQRRAAFSAASSITKAPRTLSAVRSSIPRRFYSSQQQTPPPPPPPPPKQDKIKFWPFVVIIGLATTAWIGLVNQRKDMPGVPPQQQVGLGGRLPAPAKSTPTFSGDDVTVVFVLGGPGAGKGTQCAQLVERYGFTHLSAGDLLRAEQERPGSQFGELIKDCIRNGAIVPMEVTVQLLENAMTDVVEENKKKSRNGSSKAKFLIDGFPRKMDQALKFEETVCPAKFVLFYDCPEAEMERRLLERGKTSGRADDNAESIRKRFRTFIETSMPVVDHYEKENRVVKIDATPSPDQVSKETQKRIESRLGSNF
ncbi:hypothetical protein MCOR07_005167 [Pyricularia oryzae]|uniref:Uridylate kinase n=5 Tax=Pyricularia TaxID=48558 RepID=G4MTX2_PYRO7|nr:uridylate kinase [Pyricularia oryzae 70-15]ELQ32940.1 uridylate kinase [Pyricularia oryzae Y34]KAH8838996.1 hypothetical protein MCOR01_011829 [Pyricularia oryzae]EHA54766.1 uridylate kinase [Pyricularia oryzae 70-15]KAI6287196.1 hypothetical protein MCOR26_000742 [Pyricularia oryzae]KAI6317879.1 hypothetical protein MCOR29_006108 [Pyricularia oryzae]